MSNENHETHAEIIAEARDKYTVHDCNECNWRKSCYLNSHGFDSDECREKRQSIALLFGIEDGYFTKLLCRIEAAKERELNANSKSAQVEFCNAAKLREALAKVRRVLHCAIIAGILKGDDAYDALNMATAALKEPPRNCDVGTAEEQEARYLKLKKEHIKQITYRPHVGPSFFPESLWWAQMQYESEVRNEAVL